MKTFKTENGNLSIIFSHEEVLDILSKINGQTKPIIEDDPFKGLRSGTKSFLVELKEHFGDSVIYRNHKVVKELAHKYYITDVCSILRNFEKRGYCEINRKNGKSQNIDCFILSF